MIQLEIFESGAKHEIDYKSTSRPVYRKPKITRSVTEDGIEWLISNEGKLYRKDLFNKMFTSTFKVKVLPKHSKGSL